MKLQSKRTIEYASVFALMVLAAGLWFFLMRGDRLQSSIDTGQFKAGYSNAMDTLRGHIGTLRDKLTDSDPGQINLRPEKEDPPPEAASVAEATISPSQEPRSIRLRGIYWSKTMPLADINGKLLKPGEQVAGFTVEAIQPDQVILTDRFGNSKTNHLYDTGRIVIEAAPAQN